METKPRKWGLSRIFCFAGFKTRAPLCRKAEQFSPELINQIEPTNVLARCRQIHARISTGRRSRDAIGMWPLRRSDAALDLSFAHIRSRQLRDDDLHFDRRESLYPLCIIANMMTLKEAREEASASELLSRQGKKAADARHAENREIAEEIKDWYGANHHRYKSMDAAAEAVIKLQPVSFRTARKHIGEASKELGLRVPSGEV